jgi:cell division protein FtsN
MTKSLFRLFVATLILCSVNSFAQDEYPEDKPKAPFQPMLSFGTGSYLFKGDIVGPKKNFLMGNQGYHFGAKMNMTDNLDLTFLIGNGKLNEKNDVETTSFSSDVKTAGLGLRYSFNNISQNSKLTPFLSIGGELLNFKTESRKTETAIAIPMGIGVMLDVSERIGLDMGLRYHYTLTDMIDGVEEGASDNFLVTTFTVHYDLFTPKPRKERPYSDQRFYAEVNFKALDVEDSDGDLIADIDDYCPETPEGVKVDANGCPIDDDKDGIPNYIDEEANTPRGAIVNEKGAQLTDEQSKSMYSKFNAAGREYANFYNENEISKDEFKSINEYLIAKANAYNIVNDIPSIDTKIQGKRFTVMLGEYRDDVPANVINKFLSFDDLESLLQDDGMVVYSVGSYATFDEAINRQEQLRINEGMDNTEIVEVENGVVTPYSPTPVSSVTPKKEEVEKQENIEVEESASIEATEKTEQEVVTPKKEIKSTVGKITFRVQIGAYKIALSKDIFTGVNVIPFTSNDGFTRYFTGSFTAYKDAVKHQNDMLLRGFDGSFVVAFKDGKKIGLYSAIRATNGKLPRRNTPPKVDKKEVKPNVEYVVQIGVYKENVPANVLAKMTKIGNVNKENVNGSKLYRYNAGTYSDFSSADARLNEVKSVGFDDAFVKALLDGEQIPIEKAKALSE